MVRRRKRSDLKKEKVVIITDLIFDYSNRKQYLGTESEVMQSWINNV